MFRIRYWFCISMVAAAVYDNSSYVLQVTQLGPAVRPQDDVVLFCKLSGIKTEQLQYYWWLDVATKTPIYTYSEVLRIDEITEEYRDVVISETHSITEEEIISKLTIRTKLTNQHRLKCDFAMNNGYVAWREKKIDFEGPDIQIDVMQALPIVPDNNNGEMVLILTCTVNASAGKPKLAVLCNDDKGNSIMSESEEFNANDLAGHFNANHRTVMPTTCRRINCSVTDAHGTYFVAKNISSHVACCLSHRCHVQTTEISKTADVKFWVVLTLFILSWAMTGLFALCWRITKNRGCNKNGVGNGATNSFTATASIAGSKHQQRRTEICKEDGVENFEKSELI